MTVSGGGGQVLVTWRLTHADSAKPRCVAESSTAVDGGWHAVVYRTAGSELGGLLLEASETRESDQCPVIGVIRPKPKPLSWKGYLVHALAHTCACKNIRRFRMQRFRCGPTTYISVIVALLDFFSMSLISPFLYGWWPHWICEFQMMRLRLTKDLYRTTNVHMQMQFGYEQYIPSKVVRDSLYSLWLPAVQLSCKYAILAVIGPISKFSEYVIEEVLGLTVFSRFEKKRI